MTNKKFTRAGTLLLTGFVAVLALAVGVNAAQTITTPNAAVIKYSLAAGANSADVTPAESTPVLVMGVQNDLGYRGVGEVALLHVPSSFLEWTGIESPAAAALTSGFSGAAGTHILYLDYSHTVQIEVASTDAFLIHNGNTVPMAGVVTLIW